MCCDRGSGRGAGGAAGRAGAAGGEKMESAVTARVVTVSCSVQLVQLASSLAARPQVRASYEQTRVWTLQMYPSTCTHPV